MMIIKSKSVRGKKLGVWQQDAPAEPFALFHVNFSLLVLFLSLPRRPFLCRLLTVQS
jgi:hypothetical protein